MAALILGSFSCGQWTLPDSGMNLPLKVTSRSVTGSLKSGSQPTLGQISGWFFGTPQNLVYMASVVTALSLTSKPILARLAARILPWFTAVGTFETTAVTGGPVYVPSGYPAFRSSPLPFATLPLNPGLGKGVNSKP